MNDPDDGGGMANTPITPYEILEDIVSRHRTVRDTDVFAVFKELFERIYDLEDKVALLEHRETPLRGEAAASRE